MAGDQPTTTGPTPNVVVDEPDENEVAENEVHPEEEMVEQPAGAAELRRSTHDRRLSIRYPQMSMYFLLMVESLKVFVMLWILSYSSLRRFI